MSKNPAEPEAMFEKALTIAQKHLEMALKEAGPLETYVAVAMIEAAVNQAAETASQEDIADMLRDLADQIDEDSEDDMDESDELDEVNDNEEDEDENDED